MLGNMVSESGLNPDQWEIGGGGGYGLVQWTPGYSVQNWCRNNGYNYTSLDGQCAYIQYQMTHNQQFYPSNSYNINAYQYMHSTLSPYTLAMVFLANFERPANPYQPARGQQAQYWYQYFQGHGTPNASSNQQPTQPSGNTESGQLINQIGKFTPNMAMNIRTAPSTSAPIRAAYNAGQTFGYTQKIKANGYLWASYISHTGVRVYVAIKALDNSIIFGTDSNNFSYTVTSKPSGNTPTQSSQSNSTVNQINQSGSFTPSIGLNIRRAPSTSAQIAARYNAGQTFNYTQKVESDGYLWVSYISHTGVRVYIAIKGLDNGTTFGTDSNNFSFNSTPSTNKNTGTSAQPSQNTSTANQINQSGSFTPSIGLNIRRGPSTSAQVAARYNAGQTFNYTQKVESNGYLWVSYISYTGVRVYIAIKELDNGTTFGSDSNNFSYTATSNPSGNTSAPTQPSQSNSTVNQINQSGSFTPSIGLNIRRKPSTSAQIAARYNAGQTFNYTSKIEANGYLWVSYTGFSGNPCYIAIKSLSNGETYGTDSNNFSFNGTVINNSTSQTTPTISQENKATQVVAIARQQLGKPYVWGATGPNSFDCSGLVQYVYHQIGINLPRVTTQQEKCGIAVSLDSLQPGDLLFWGTPGNSYHVGIYTGNGNMLFAPQPGQNVKEEPMQYYMPSFARRIL